MGKTTWRTEPVNVEKFLDELWIGVKGQSNWEIAGSLRNIFRYGLRSCLRGVEHCMDEGVSQPADSKQTPNTCSGVPAKCLHFVGVLHGPRETGAVR